MTTIDSPGDAAVGFGETADADLVVRTRSGERAAFGELWNRHYRSGIAVARAVSANHDPDDLVQEAYTRIYQSILRGGGPTGSFRAYLFTSIRNTAAAWGRSGRETAFDLLDTVEDPLTSDEAAEAALDRGLTHRAFRSLPTRWQEVLWYTEIEQMKPAEVAPLLGMKPTAVAQLAFRAREGLREAWIQAHLRAVEDGSDCQWTIERLGAHARANLSRRDQRKVDLHLAGCARCTIVATEARDVSGRLALVLLPLVLGATGSAAYLATLPGGGVAAVTLAAAGSSLAPGSVAGSASSAAVAGGSASGAAPAAAAGATGAGASAGGVFAGGSTLTGGAAAAGSAGIAAAGGAGIAAAGGAAGGITAAVGVFLGTTAAVVALAGSVTTGMVAAPEPTATPTPIVIVVSEGVEAASVGSASGGDESAMLTGDPLTGELLETSEIGDADGVPVDAPTTDAAPETGSPSVEGEGAVDGQHAEDSAKAEKAHRSQGPQSPVSEKTAPAAKVPAGTGQPGNGNPVGPGQTGNGNPVGPGQTGNGNPVGPGQPGSGPGIPSSSAVGRDRPVPQQAADAPGQAARATTPASPAADRSAFHPAGGRAAAPATPPVHRSEGGPATPSLDTPAPPAADVDGEPAP